MKPLPFLFLLLFIAAMVYLLRPSKTTSFNIPKIPALFVKENGFVRRLKNKAACCKPFLKHNGFSTRYVFLIDMSLPSGRNRFFMYNLQSDSVISSGLVAHGSCGTKYLDQPRFSNLPECGCSSEGRYRVGSSYEGRFGKAFKLFGLDSTNSSAYNRSIVLHAYGCVPDHETYPYLICNSLGCPMVSYKFLDTIAPLIEKSEKPILLWIYQ